MDDETLRQVFMYDGWWQFEEGFESFQEETDESSIKIISSVQPTDRSYAVVSLDTGQNMLNTFRVSRTGTYNIEFFGALSKTIDRKNTDISKAVKMYVNSEEINVSNMTETNCREYGIWYYCTYGAEVDLDKGKHTLMMKSLSKQILLDKFRMFRNLPTKESYDIKIVDVVTEA